MEELDKLKKDWNRSQDNYPKFSEREIYAMLHKGSSSVVKWILIISILEFVFWLGLSFLLKDSPNVKRVDGSLVDYITVPMSLVSYGIIIYFFCIFYMNYRKITTTDNVKTLMANILRTRKAVSNYIFVNIAYIIVSSIIIFFIFFKYDKGLLDTLHQSEASGQQVAFYLTYIIFTLLSIGILILIIWLFYKLIYGLLLRKLHRNYEELKKIDF